MNNIKAVTIKITSHCNFKCEFCYENINDKTDMSFDDINSMFVKLKKLGVEILSISGGEPTLRTDIVEIVKKASDYGFLVRLATNGELLSNVLMKGLQKSGLGVLHISIGDMANEEHVNKVFETLKTFAMYKDKMHVALNIITTKKFIRHISNHMVNIIQNSFADMIEFIPPKFSNNTKWFQENKLNFDDEKILFHHINKYQNDIKMIGSCGYKSFQNCFLEMDKLLFLSITSEGKVYKCPYVETQKHYIGDIKNEIIIDCIENYENIKTNTRCLPCMFDKEGYL